MPDKEKPGDGFIPADGNEPATGDESGWKILRCRSQRCNHRYLGKARLDKKADIELMCPVCKTVNFFVISIEN